MFRWLLDLTLSPDDITLRDGKERLRREAAQKAELEQWLAKRRLLKVHTENNGQDSVDYYWQAPLTKRDGSEQ